MVRGIYGLPLTNISYFNHTNIIRYTNRPFDSVDEMNHVIIDNHNKVVGVNDEVYHLGDFSFQTPIQYLKRLNGKHYLIKGNHDYKQSVLAINGGFQWVKDVYLLKDPKPMFFLSHYPHRTWPHSHRGSIHLHGHCHNTLPMYGRSMDIGVDGNNFTPWHIDDIIKKMSEVEHYHNEKNEVI